jgi:hypothetical protein
MIEAKILEDSIKQKQQISREEARIARIVRRDQSKFATLLDRGHEALSEHDVNVARIDARKAEALHKIMARLTRGHPSASSEREMRRQDRQLDGLAYSILKDTTGTAAGLKPHHYWSRRGTGDRARGRAEEGRERSMGEEQAPSKQESKEIKSLKETVKSLAQEVRAMRARRQEEHLVAQGLGAGRNAGGSGGMGRDVADLKRQLAKLAGKVAAIEGSPANLRSHAAALAKDGSYGSLGYQVRLFLISFFLSILSCYIRQPRAPHYRFATHAIYYHSAAYFSLPPPLPLAHPALPGQERAFAKALAQGEEAAARGDGKAALLALRRSLTALLPSTLHPTPCTRSPKTYTLHPSCTPRPTPQHPTP